MLVLVPQEHFEWYFFIQANADKTYKVVGDVKYTYKIAHCDPVNARHVCSLAREDWGPCLLSQEWETHHQSSVGMLPQNAHNTDWEKNPAHYNTLVQAGEDHRYGKAGIYRCSNLHGREAEIHSAPCLCKTWLSRLRSTLRLRPGHTALYGLITAKTRQKAVSREADDVVRVDVEFKTSYSRFIDVAGRGEKLERRRTWQKVLNCSKS